jgi:hypothetical protein
MEAKPEIRMLAKLGFYKKPMGEGAIVLLARAQKLRKGIDRLGHFFEFLEKLADRFENINQRD